MNKDGDIKTKTVSNLIWRFAERVGAQGVTLLVSIVIARILSPSDYGIIALVTIFTSVLQVFIDSGLGTALIQNKDADDLDFSTVFLFNVVFCLVFYVGLFITAPYIADFYDNMALTSVVRVLGLTLIISGVKNVQQAYVSRNLLFKKFFFSTLGGTIGAGILGITMAYLGFGVWALVVQQIFNATVDTVILWLTVKWRPKKTFSFKRLKLLFNYGWKILVAMLVNTVYQNIRQLIIGKVYSPQDLAFYNRGKQFPDVFVSNINSSIDSVLLPVMANKQNDREALKNMTRRAISVSSYIMWPLMLGLLSMGESFISFVLTDKWLPAFPFLAIFCVVKGFEPIHTANLNAIKAMGYSDIILRIEVTKKVIGIVLIFITMHISVFALGFSSVIYTIIAGILNASPNKKLLNYTYIEQIKDILPSLAMATIMAIIVYFVGYIKVPIIFKLISQIFMGGVIYILLSVLFKSISFKYVYNIVRKYIKSNKI